MVSSSGLFRFHDIAQYILAGVKKLAMQDFMGMKNKVSSLILDCLYKCPHMLYC